MRVWNPFKGSSYDPDAQSVIAPNPMTQPIRHALGFKRLEPGYRPYPLSRIVSVVAAPAVIETAAVGPNPWDIAHGPVGQPLAFGLVRALPIPPQVSSTGY